MAVTGGEPCKARRLFSATRVHMQRDRWTEVGWGHQGSQREGGENFPYFFLSNLDASVLCLIALARTVSTMLNRDGERAHPCLVPDLGGGEASSRSPLVVMLAVGFLWLPFIRFKKSSRLLC